MNKIAYDENKIKIMAKLAVYDKRTSENDLKKTSHFRHDYVYKRNSSIRLGVFIGTLIIAVFYALHLATINELDLFILIATGAYRPYFMNL
ncbi:MAG: hypothetical protein LBM16_00550, partial [Clostridiales bacterium]|nr:hypothetical protein [Clostridiales bacterium]